MTDIIEFQNSKVRLRAEAEAIVQNKVSQLHHEIEGMSINELKKMFEEFEIHKIELEMQNEELRDTQEQLSLSKEKYFDLYNLAPVGYITMNSDGIMTALNLTAARMLGVVSSSVIEKNFCMFISFEDQDKCYLYRKRILESGQTQSCDMLMFKEDKKTFWAHLVGKLVQDQKNDFSIAIIISDITKDIKNKEALLKAKEEAEQANKLKSEFLANMSHEIRTPLNGILGLIDLVLKTDLNEKQRDYLKKSQTSSIALLHIINDILDYSKIVAGKLNLENNIFELENILNNLKDLFEYQIKTKGLEFKIEGVSHLTLRGDELRLTQILINILGNAIKFTEQGSIKLTITISQEDERFMVLQFVVQDTGAGMSKKNQENLFKEFSQADNSITRKYGGSGLGLTISKQLVKLMYGDIWMTSQEAHGSTFTFTANFEKAQQEKQILPLKDKNTLLDTLNTSILKDARILLVEDNEVNQIVVIGLLENFAPLITSVWNGQEAVDLAKKNDYDLILMDLQMPIMDGFEATKQIKQLPNHKNTPIIALSAAVMNEDILKTSKANMVAHLAKPINNNELIGSIIKFIKPQKNTSEYLIKEEQKLKNEGSTTRFYGIDLDELKSRIGNNPKIIQKIVRKFCEDYANPEQIFDISQIGTDSFNHAVHTLKGVSGNVSLIKIYQLSKAIHDNSDIEFKKELTPKLIAILQETVEKLKNELSINEA